MVMRELFCTKVLVEQEFFPLPAKLIIVHAFETIGATTNYTGATLTWHLGFVEPCIVRSSKRLFIIKSFCMFSDSQIAEWRYDI